MTVLERRLRDSIRVTRLLHFIETLRGRAAKRWRDPVTVRSLHAREERARRLIDRLRARGD